MHGSTTAPPVAVGQLAAVQWEALAPLRNHAYDKRQLLPCVPFATGPVRIAGGPCGRLTAAAAGAGRHGPDHASDEPGSCFAGGG